MITIRRYRPTLEKDWNSFLAASCNGTFLLDRRYMDYHKDRFRDHSLLLYDKQKLTALLPAHVKGQTVFSHAGLSYAGLIVAPDTSLLTTLSCFYNITRYYNQKGCTTLIYHPVPSFFHAQPFLHDTYAMHLLDAKITRVTTGFVADLTVPIHFSRRRSRQLQKAKKHGVRLHKARDCRYFWTDILTPRLLSRFGRKPVHTLEEIERLRNKFPQNIAQYTATVGGRISAGVTLFKNRNVAHAQYIASNELGRTTGSLDYLFWRLMTGSIKGITKLSFGISNEPGTKGRVLNTGLAKWKEEFGAIMTPHIQYTVRTKNFRSLAKYM